jgi:translation initiation factor 3 subunit H
LSLYIHTSKIGWYQSTFLGVHVKQFLIDVQYAYQQETPESVVITYDPLVASHGSVGLKAFRLSDTFMKLRKDNTFSKEKYGRGAD